MKKGFTLIEMLVVVLIVGVLAAVAIPQFESAIEKSRTTEALVTAKAIKDAVQRYYQANPNEMGTPVCHWYQIADVDLNSDQWAPKMSAAGSGGCDSYRTQTFTYDLGEDALLIYRIDRANPAADREAPSDRDAAEYEIKYMITPYDNTKGCDPRGNEKYESICRFIETL